MLLFTIYDRNDKVDIITKHEKFSMLNMHGLSKSVLFDGITIITGICNDVYGLTVTFEVEC